jgi:putative restriction endonuclease
MTRDEILRAFDSLRVWQKGGRRAPHKPLLILLALGRLASGEPGPVEFSRIEGSLRELLREFGPDGAEKSRHYPFWHLKTDGVWQLDGPQEILERPPSATPTIGELREGRISGVLPKSIRDALQADPTLLLEISRRIVDAHFPESIRSDVLEAVGLELEEGARGGPASRVRPRRDPSFRERVLMAYERRCCVCGYDLRLADHVIGLEAAHIKWFQAGGPDTEPNGLALCSLHHKMFDLGAFTILPDGHQIVFSRHLVGTREVQERLLSYHGASLIQPQSTEHLPNAEYLAWHTREVFKGPYRDTHGGQA